MKTTTYYRTENNVEKCIFADAHNSTQEATLATAEGQITSSSTIAQIETIFIGTGLDYVKGNVGNEITIGGGRPRKIRHL